MDDERHALLLQIIRCVILATLLTFAVWGGAITAFDWFNLGM